MRRQGIVRLVRAARDQNKRQCGKALATRPRLHLYSARLNERRRSWCPECSKLAPSCFPPQKSSSPQNSIHSTSRLSHCTKNLHRTEHSIDLGDELLAEALLLLRIPMGGRAQLEACTARQDDAFHFERSSPRRRDRTEAQSSRDVGSSAVSCARRSSSASHAASHSESPLPSTLLSNSVARANRSSAGRRNASSRIPGRGCSLMQSTLAPIQVHGQPHCDGAGLRQRRGH
jgi:hypothetical protein